MSALQTIYRKAKFPTLLGGFLLFYALVIGMATAILPITYSMMLIGLPVLFLLWVLPDIQTRAQHFARWAMIAFILPNEVIPNYYTLIVPGLPWINVRRLFLAVAVSAFVFALASSSGLRKQMADQVKSTKLISIAIIGFLINQLLSGFVALNPAQSLSYVVNWIINIYIPLFCVATLFRAKDVRIAMYLLAISAIVNCVIGYIEARLGHSFLYLLLPESTRQTLVADNPKMAVIMGGGFFRNGYYRATSTFVISLSWGEFAAITAPITFFFLTSRSRYVQLFGAVSAAASLYSVFMSGSRGGYLGLICGTGCYCLFWTVRFIRQRPESFAGVLLSAAYLFSIPTILGAITSIGFLRRMIIGTGGQQASNDGRSAQWALGMPKLMARPLLGYGATSSGIVVGFYPNGLEGGPTVDNYILTLLMDYGITGCLLFFAIFMVSIYVSLKMSLEDNQDRNNLALSLGSSLIAFVVYRPFLSQTDNHTYVFIIVGLILAVIRSGRFKSEKDGVTDSQSRTSSRVTA